jgi:hypothetical protein
MTSKSYTRIKLDPYERRLATASMEVGLIHLNRELEQMNDLAEQGLCRARISVFEDVIQRLASSRRIALPATHLAALKFMLRLGSSPEHRVIERKLDGAVQSDRSSV